jgi:hypothetical protein
VPRGKIWQIDDRGLGRRAKISDGLDFLALFLDNVGNRLGLWSRT